MHQINQTYILQNCDNKILKGRLKNIQLDPGNTMESLGMHLWGIWYVMKVDAQNSREGVDFAVCGTGNSH